MNTIEVKGWQCGICKNIFPFENQDLAFFCCKCDICDKESANYVGTSNYCEKHHLEIEVLPRLEKQLEVNAIDISATKKRLEKLNNDSQIS